MPEPINSFLASFVVLASVAMTASFPDSTRTMIFSAFAFPAVLNTFPAFVKRAALCDVLIIVSFDADFPDLGNNLLVADFSAFDSTVLLGLESSPCVPDIA